MYAKVPDGVIIPLERGDYVIDLLGNLQLGEFGDVPGGWGALEYRGEYKASSKLGEMGDF